MRFASDVDQLSAAAAFAARHATGAAAIPALSGVRVQAENDVVRLTGYDYEASSVVTIEAKVEEPGERLAPGRVFAEILRSLPSGPVEVASVGGSVEIAAGPIEFALPTLSMDDYPELPSPPEPIGEVDGAALAVTTAALSRIALREDVIPVLSGIHLEFGAETLTLTASDRFRIAMRELSWSEVPTDSSALELFSSRPTEVIVPARMLADTTRHLRPTESTDAVRIGVGEADQSLISLATSERLSVLRLLDGKYPPFRSKVPTSFAGSVVVAVDEFRAALKRVCIVADRYAAVTLTFDSDGIVVGAAGDVDARGREFLAAQCEGERATVGFNASYLLDGLDVLDSPYVRLAFNTGMQPALLTPRDALDGDDRSDILYVVMPRRLPTTG
jgi:DNA polymerase-3 subunit beta